MVGPAIHGGLLSIVSDPEIAEITDYGCLIPTSGTGVCPVPAATDSGTKYYFVPPLWFLASAGGLLKTRSKQMTGNWVGKASGDDFKSWDDNQAATRVTWTDFHVYATYTDAVKYTPFAGSIAGEIYVTNANFRGFTGQGLDTNIIYT